MKKRINQLISISLILTIFFSLIAPINANQEEPNTPKEEVIYVNLNPTGTVEEVNAVNIVEHTSNGLITDYGSYHGLRNLTTTDEIQYSGDKINIKTEADKIYYEGKLNSNVIPWDFHISYFLNGKEMSLDELPGKSGNLSIHFDITQNKNCHDNFFDSYALQATFLFDTEKFTNINALDATTANVGKDKQLTYTVLPGKGIHTTITADVSDFDMDPISINALPLNLDIEVDKENLTNKVNDLNDAISAINNGAGNLKSGISKLGNSSKNDLKSGVDSLSTGATELNNGAGVLVNGGKELNSGANDVNVGASRLSSGAESLNSGIIQVQNALNELNKQSENLRSGSNSFKEALSQLQSALNNISSVNQDLTPLLDASNQIKNGINQLVNGLSLLQTSISLDSYKNVMNENGLNIDDLKNKNIQAIETLQQQIETLKEQIEQLTEAGMDAGTLQSQIEQLEQIKNLLEANNLMIGGTESYLATANENISPLLEGAQSLESNYKTFDDSLTQLVSTLTDLTSKVSDLTTAVNTLSTEYEKLDSGIINYTDGVSQILNGYTQITSGSQQLTIGAQNLKAGTESLYNGSNQLLSGIGSAYNATNQFKNGTVTLGNGVKTLNSGIDQLLSGANNLSDGTLTLQTETKDMNNQIDEEINNMVTSITGDSFKLESFVSEKNTNIKSVQFVIKTKAISAPKTEAPTSSEKPELNFWQKLLKLFGLYKETN